MSKAMIRFAVLSVVTLSVPIQAVTAKERVIIDTDFAMPPQDDGLALIMALNSPELEILGITTVAGNFSREQATVDALRILEIGCLFREVLLASFVSSAMYDSRWIPPAFSVFKHV